MTNSWQKLVVALAQAPDELPSPHPLHERMTREELVARELYKGEDVDAAVHSFSTSGAWPLLNGEEAYLIEERIKYALIVAKSMAVADPHGGEEGAAMFPEPPEDFSIEFQLQWLLGAAWNAVGRTIWAGRPFSS